MTARIHHLPPAADGSVFDVADPDLTVGDVFRWPFGDGSRRWRIVEVLDPDVDEFTQRVRAVLAGPYEVCAFCAEVGTVAPATTTADDGEGARKPACDDCARALGPNMFIEGSP